MSEGARTSRRRSSLASDRRPLRFWDPFNTWWRAELERTGKRASSDDIARWYAAQSIHAWGPEKPSLQETRTHAKCLRSVSSVRDYFREYRAKKKHEQSELDMDDEDEEDDDGRSRSHASRRASGSRSRAARSTSTAGYSDASGAMQGAYLGYDEHSGYWGSGYMEAAPSGATTAAGDAATTGAEVQGAAAAAAAAAAGQAAAEYGQHVLDFDMASVHPGALDAAWASYQHAAAAGEVGAAEGLMMPTMQQVAHYLAQEQQQQDAAHAGGDAAAASGGSQQQQGSEEAQLQGVSDAAAGRVGMHGLLSPVLLGSDAHFQLETPCMSPRQTQRPRRMPAAAGVHIKQEALTPPGILQQAQQLPVPLWDIAAQQQHDGPAAYLGSLGALQQTQQQHQQFVGGSMACWKQESAATARPEGAARSSPAALSIPGSTRATGTPADAPQQAGSQHCAGQETARKSRQLHSRTADAPLAAAAVSTPAAGDDASAGAAEAAADATRAEPPDSTRVIPASLLAAVPLPLGMPGCPGHSTVDSILRQLESGARTPRGLAAGADGQMPFSRMSLSALLEAPSLLLHGAGTARQLSQSFEHLPLGQPRMSLYAMGSGMLDMLSEGLDLETFLAAGDLAGAAAGGGGGGGGFHAAAAAGAGGGGSAFADAAMAASGRLSARWLRSSYHMQVPEHWQQHLQAWHDAPLRAGPHALAINARRASSAGIDALAEAAAAALAAHPELLQDHAAGPAAAAAAAAPPAEQEAAAGAGAADAGGLGPACGQKRRAGEERAASGGAAAGGDASAAAMGPPGPISKRPCVRAGLSLDLASDHAQQQAFKYVLDLATPKPRANAHQDAAQQQKQEQEQQQAPEQTQLDLGAATATLPAGQPQGPTAAQKRPVVLDLRPEEMGATSENCIATPAHGAGHVSALGQQQQQTAGQQAAVAETAPSGGHARRQGSKRADGLMLPPLQSPGAPSGAAGVAGVSTRGALQSGPATAASTTALPPLGPNGAALPAPAMAHVAMAAAMSAAAAPERPGEDSGARVAGGGGAAAAAAPGLPSDPAKRLLPAMQDIERMI